LRLSKEGTPMMMDTCVQVNYMLWDQSTEMISDQEVTQAFQQSVNNAQVRDGINNMIF
jgi:hypothetical protein